MGKSRPHNCDSGLYDDDTGDDEYDDDKDEDDDDKDEDKDEDDDDKDEDEDENDGVYKSPSHLGQTIKSLSIPSSRSTSSGIIRTWQYL